MTSSPISRKHCASGWNCRKLRTALGLADDHRLPSATSPNAGPGASSLEEQDCANFEEFVHVHSRRPHDNTPHL